MLNVFNRDATAGNCESCDEVEANSTGDGMRVVTFCLRGTKSAVVRKQKWCCGPLFLYYCRIGSLMADRNVNNWRTILVWSEP